MLLSMRGTPLEKTPGARIVELKVKSALELMNFHYSFFLFPLPISLDFSQFLPNFQLLDGFIENKDGLFVNFLIYPYIFFLILHIAENLAEFSSNFENSYLYL